MREIKFELVEYDFESVRPKIIGYETCHPSFDGGVWYYVLYSEGDEAVCHAELYWPKGMNHIIRRQYTGLKDKNGKEIYEGDIVECSMSFEGGTLPHMGEIVYDETFGSFGTKNEAGVTLLYNHCLHTIEVIGNIYEQSHLLNK